MALNLPSPDLSNVESGDHYENNSFFGCKAVVNNSAENNTSRTEPLPPYAFFVQPKFEKQIRGVVPLVPVGSDRGRSGVEGVHGVRELVTRSYGGWFGGGEGAIKEGQLDGGGR